MIKWKWFLASFVMTGGFVSAALYLYLMFWGPDMRLQGVLKSYESDLSMPPEGTVRIDPPSPSVRSKMQDSPQAGRVYYGYYCAYCHGPDGKGDGPVGQSYVPMPADLTLDRIGQMSDDALTRAMLDGKGHAPVMRRIVEPDHFSHILTFIRQWGR